MSEVVYEQKIDLPYRYTAGPAQRAALTGLREGRLVGSRGGDWLAVPAKPFGPDGRRLDETVEVEPRGTLLAATIAHCVPGAPTFGLIRVEGASGALLHRLGAGAEELAPGSPVRAVWRDDRSGSITDIAYFAPA